MLRRTQASSCAQCITHFLSQAISTQSTATAPGSIRLCTPPLPYIYSEINASTPCNHTTSSPSTADTCTDLPEQAGSLIHGSLPQLTSLLRKAAILQVLISAHHACDAGMATIAPVTQTTTCRNSRASPTLNGKEMALRKRHHANEKISRQLKQLYT